MRRASCLALTLIVVLGGIAYGGGVHLLRADHYLDAHDRPFDLAGSSLVFTPAGGSYAVTRTSLQYDTNVGTLLHRFEPGSGPQWHFTRYVLSHFSFPYGGINRTELYPYVWGGAFFTPPPLLQSPLTDASVQSNPVIAAFLLPQGGGVIIPAPDLFVRETDTELLLTWTTDTVSPYWTSIGLGFDVQLRLRNDGQVVFSYRETGQITWPAVGLINDNIVPPVPPLPQVPPAPPLAGSRDLSTVTPAPLPLPLFEVFSVPSLDTALVWRDLQAANGYRDDEIDAVAIYQDFYTDIVYFAAAFCEGGNPGVDGLMNVSNSRVGTSWPKRAAVMHMSAVTRTGGAMLLLHEFAHRWLYFFDWIETGQTRSQAGHPTYFTDTTAAFPTGPGDHSPLGGSAWVDKGNGTFTTANGAFNAGYSWHELYFMGLAAPEEVAPWFFIDLPQPVSFTASQTTYSGVRHPMELTSVIAADGPRRPSYATSQKHFKIVLVLLTHDPEHVNADVVARLLETRMATASRFAAATGGRGTLEFLPAVPKRRTAPH